MRDALARIDGTRGTFTGTFKRFGSKTAYKGPPLKTVLLVELKDEAGQPACDHLWFNLTKEFAALKLEPGDVVKFDARIKAYWKGYGPREEQSRDYKLSHPTKVRKINAQPVSALPLLQNAAEMQPLLL